MTYWMVDRLSFEFEDGDAVFEAVERTSLARIRVTFRPPAHFRGEMGQSLETLLRLRAEQLLASFAAQSDEEEIDRLAS